MQTAGIKLQVEKVYNELVSTIYHLVAQVVKYYQNITFSKMIFVYGQ